MIWKKIPGLTGYKISEKGDVRGRFRVVLNRGKTYLKNSANIRAHRNRGGYWTVRLSHKGKVRNYPIHQLVALAFIGPNPDTDRYTVDHIDRNKENNHYSNLRYATREQQNENRILAPPKRGEASPTAKLSREEVGRMREEWDGGRGKSFEQLGRDYNISATQVARICRGIQWARM